jgi:hypothetical protein
LIDLLEVIEPPEQWADRRRRWGYYAYDRGFIGGADCDFDVTKSPDPSAIACRSAPIRVIYATYTEELHPNSRELAQFMAVAKSMKSLTGLGAEWDYTYELNPYWEHYLRSPVASGLRLLDLNYSRGYDTCPFVAELTHLTNLQVLDLTVCCRFEDNDLQLLANAPHLQSLVALRLAANDEYRGSITAEGIARLTDSLYLTNLRQLTLNNHEDLNDDAVSRLLEWKHVGQLEVLELSCRDITDAGVRALSRDPQLRNLRRLVLDGTRLESDTILQLLDSRHLSGLLELYLSPPPTSLSITALQRLRERFPHFANMRFDPPAVCVEDRLRGRYRLMIHPCGDGTYRGRDQAYSPDGRQEPPLYPEYAIL